MGSQKVVFLRDDHYMKKCKKVNQGSNYRKMIFFDHNHEEITGVIHAFPVRRKSVGLYVDRYRQVRWLRKEELRYRMVTPPLGWKIYALEWHSTDVFVASSQASAPQPLRFNPDIHTSKECFEYHRELCGCCVSKEWGIVSDYQVVFAPRAIAYISSGSGSR